MSALPTERTALANAYREAYHDAMCPSGARCTARLACSWAWVAHVDPSAWLAAVKHLEASPRDAAGARRVLHDAVCHAGAECPRPDEHARTQTMVVRVLRKVLAGRPMVLLSQDVDTP